MYREGVRSLRREPGLSRTEEPNDEELSHWALKTDMKKIKLMAEYGRCLPLWDIEEGLLVEEGSLPISDALTSELFAWAEWYDQCLNFEDPASSGFRSDAELENFERQGITLWEKLKTELSDGHQIFYFSEVHQKLMQ